MLAPGVRLPRLWVQARWVECFDGGKMGDLDDSGDGSGADAHSGADWHLLLYLTPTLCVTLCVTPCCCARAGSPLPCVGAHTMGVELFDGGEMGDLDGSGDGSCDAPGADEHSRADWHLLPQHHLHCLRPCV